MADSWRAAPGAGLDLSTAVFVLQSVPGETTDALFDWSGKNLGWDIYGTGPDRAQHAPVRRPTTRPTRNPNYFDPVTKEYCPDHGKPFPVMLPETQFLTVGPFYSGSPFMGALGALPPGEGGLNPNGGFPFMWHSHSEKGAHKQQHVSRRHDDYADHRAAWRAASGMKGGTQK